MKHIIILGDGMADHPVERLGGKTLLQYANKPYMDMLAKKGKTGRLVTVPDGFHPGSEVANSSIMGYDQNEVYEGRGPLEAASIGYELEPTDLALRCNIINVQDGLSPTTVVTWKRKMRMCSSSISTIPSARNILTSSLLPASSIAIFWW